MAHDAPSRYIAKMSKAARAGKIFVDYLRNDVTSTAVAPFSARARTGATVSTPLEWKELTAKLRLSGFTIETVPQRLQKQKSDPWADFGDIQQTIDAKHLKALKIDPI
jgi:bifunctional non-homologous end joining protein LigD